MIEYQYNSIIMSSAHRKKQIQAMQDGADDDSYIFGNHRGGGGAPLISARSGNQVTKMGQVINGNKQIDGDMYNGVNGVERPKTAFDHRTPNGPPDRHDLFTPSKSINSSPSDNKIEHSRYKQKHQQGNHDSPSRSSLPSSNSNQRTSGMASLLTDASGYGGTHAPDPIKTKLSRFEEEESVATEESVMPRITQRKARNLAVESEPSAQLFSVPAQHKAAAAMPQAAPSIDISSILLGQQAILNEMQAMKEFSVKQAMLKSLRWGLSNLNMVDQATCVGTLGGVSLPPITLSELVKKVLIEFMKGNGCNVGTRSTLSSHGNAPEGEQRFLQQLFDSIHALTGVPPEVVRREDGDYEVYFGDCLA